MEQLGGFKRRHPRRPFVSPVGVLFSGGYLIEKAGELGEGGLLFYSRNGFSKEAQLLVSFYIPNSKIACTIGVIRYVSKVKHFPAVNAYGIQFRDLSIEFRRYIRAYIASSKT